MSSDLPIVICGDPHRGFARIIDYCKRLPKAGALILLGDLELFSPLTETLRPLYDAGWDVQWILGNHDSDNIRQYVNLVSSLQDHPNGSLGLRWAQISNLIVAGVPGIFKDRVWYPKYGDEAVIFRTRKDYIKQVRKHERWQPDIADIPALKGMPLNGRDTIFPEDVEKLSAYRLDVIVSHEAPRTAALGTKGFAALDALADATGCRLWVHGHHHKSYSEQVTLPSGRLLTVRGLAIGECWNLEMP